ncbi:MAG: hypothetical protein OHK0046_24130 [Anaerolineae bacterium]
MKFWAVMLLGLLAGLLVSCAEEGNPAEAVEQYFQAQVNADADAMRGVLCSELEAELSIRANSFAGLDVELRDMECSAGDVQNNTSTVTCDGLIFVNYGTEASELPLTSYRAVREDGEWKMCGEA